MQQIYLLYTQRCANATNILYTQHRQMATLDAPKVLVLTNKTKLTLTITLTLTEHSNSHIFTRILSTPMKMLYRNNKINFCEGLVAGFVDGPVFFRFLTFYPFADKNSIASSYFIIEKRFFVGIYKKKGLGLLWA